jgi:hypothetical protein
LPGGSRGLGDVYKRQIQRFFDALDFNQKNQFELISKFSYCINNNIYYLSR